MKRSKIIIRFLDKYNAECIRELLDGVYDDWRDCTSPHTKTEQYARVKISEIGNFVSELDEYLQQNQFSELGFYILIELFFEKDSFIARESFMYEFIHDWKGNSKVKKKRKKVKKIITLLSFLRALNEKPYSKKFSFLK